MPIRRTVLRWLRDGSVPQEESANSQKRPGLGARSLHGSSELSVPESAAARTADIVRQIDRFLVQPSQAGMPVYLLCKLSAR